MIELPTATGGAPRGRPWLATYPAGLSWEQPLPPHALTALFDQSVRDHADKPCTVFAGRTLTYREIAAQVAAAASLLTAQGVTKGDRIGLLLPNTPTYIVYFYAALKCGAVVVNYNPQQTIADLERQIRDSGTSVMVTLDLKPLFEKVEALLTSQVLRRAVVASFTALLPASKAIVHRLFKASDVAQPARSTVADRLALDGMPSATPTVTAAPLPVIQPSDLAVLQYTGGTTGMPKGAMLTHANLSINAAQLTAWSAALLAPGRERILAVLPFFHVFAMTSVVIFGIGLGAEIVIQPRFVLDETIDLITRTRPTIMPGVPTLFAALAMQKSKAKLDLGSLKLCLSGGAGLPAEVRNAFEAITSAKLVEAYGLSETSPGVTCNPLDGRARPGSIGLPLPQTLVAIRDADAPDRDVPLGQTGEICVAGPQVTRGYWNRPDDSAAAFVGAYLRTGDIGYMDRDGYVFVVDRIKDVINTSGFKVYPRHIEEKLYEHAAVEEATVIAVVDATRGEVPKAFVKLKAGAAATVAELAAHLATRLSKIELPAEIELREALPKTVIGKLSKKELIAEEVAKRSKP